MVFSLTRTISSSVIRQNAFVGHGLSGLTASSYSHSRSFTVRSQLNHPQPEPGVKHPVWYQLTIQAKLSPEVEDGSVDQRWQKQSERAIQSGVVPANTYTGRSIRVRDHNIAAAFKTLRTRLSVNNVGREFRAQQRHEKKGIKRRRLKSERWRRLFANEVRKKVKLVDKIRHRGA